MWLNTELKICYLSLEAVTEGHSLTTFVIIKESAIFQQSILLENSSNHYPKEFQTNSQSKPFKEPLT